MRWSRRYILGALTLLSLGLCAAVCMLWIRSHAHADLVMLESASRKTACSAISDRGKIRFALVHYRCDRGQYGPNLRSFRHDTKDQFDLFLLGMAYGRLVRDPLQEWPWIGSGEADFSGGHAPPPPRPLDHAYRYIVTPHWLLAVLTALLPAMWVWRHLWSLHRTRPGFCRACGYDLRATPDRCPECGMVSMKAKR
jgi:hypothetical protein